MRPIATDGLAMFVCPSVCLSVSVSVGQVRGPCRNVWTHCDVWLKGPCIRWCGDLPTGRSNCPTSWKASGVSAALYAARGIIQSSI